MKYLVTGGGGFIGSNIVQELVRRNEDVRVLDNFSTGYRRNLDPYKDQISIMEGDIRSYHVVSEAVENMDFVIHQAALPSVPRSMADPITTNDVNLSGTLNILHASVQYKVKRVIFASSSSIYGNSEVLPKSEDLKPNPMSPYAVSKLAGEKYCQVFTKQYNLHTTILRYFNVFGPNQDPYSQYSAVIPKFIYRMLRGEKPIIFGDGEQSRDFTFVENVVKANIAATRVNTDPGLVLNCASNQHITVNSLIKTINKILNKDINPEYQNERPGDVKHSFADISRIKHTLDYEPDVLFDEGMQRTIQWFKNNVTESNRV